MSKSVLYAANTAAQALTAGSVISFGSVVRRFGCGCNLSGGNPVVSGSGYYDIDANVTLTAGAAGTAVVTLYKDGTAVPGGVASATAASGDLVSLSIPAILRNTCCCESTLTAVLSGIAGTVNNAAIAIEKI